MSAHEQVVVDQTHMARAFQLAKRSLFISDPNPRVGCVLVNNNHVIAEGWTQAAGKEHAEVHAIQLANSAGETTLGATAYVTLEPCCHTGLTGPCTQALIDAGIKRVVIACEDPNPQVAGKGIEILKQAGLEVSDPLMEDQFRLLNPGFVKRMRQGLPFIRVKMAMSVDGRTAMASGESKWITSAPARADVHALRAQSSAVVTGIGTIQLDNPELCVREQELAKSETIIRQPLRVIVDSAGQLQPDARTLKCDGNVLHVTGENISSSISQKNYQHKTVALKQNKIGLRALLHYLSELQCNEILVEAGATLAGQFLQQGLVDELIIYVAPKLLGSSARPLFDMPLDTMAAQLGLHIHSMRAVGQDWRITATIDPES